MAERLLTETMRDLAAVSLDPADYSGPDGHERAFQEYTNLFSAVSGGIKPELGDGTTTESLVEQIPSLRAALVGLATTGKLRPAAPEGANQG